MEAEIELWLKVIGSYGFPIASVLLLLWLVRAAAKAVWGFLMPRVDKVIDAHMTFLQTLTENDTRHTEAMQTLTNSGKQAHDKTHAELGHIKDKVVDIHRKVVG